MKDSKFFNTEQEHPMKPGFSFIACIIDRSGSMQSLRSDAVGGFNSFIEEQKKHPDEALLTLVLFNGDYQVVFDARPLGDIPPLTDATYVPSGSTALLDAVGRTIDDVGKRLAAMDEEQRPETVIVAILTDGEENSSRTYSLQQIASMIQHQQDVYKWEFLFLAADQDAITVAQSMSIHAADAVRFDSTSAGVKEGFYKLAVDVSHKRSKKK
jgi:uncharacterized protein YegL